MTAQKFIHGITLIELVIVIVILSMIGIAAVAISNPDPADLTLHSHAERLASDLRLAQNLAYTSAAPTAVTNSGGSAYTISPCSGACTTPTVALDTGIDLSGGPVKFFSNGKPDPNSNNSFIMTSPCGAKRTISVTSEGLVSTTSSACTL